MNRWGLMSHSLTMSLVFKVYQLLKTFTSLLGPPYSFILSRQNVVLSFGENFDLTCILSRLTVPTTSLKLLSQKTQ